MNRRINTRVVNRGIDGVAVLIDKDASEVYWITDNPRVLNTMGLIQMYDGFDAGGRMVWQLEPGYGHTHNFIPPIHCEQGVFVLTDTNISSYTIAWRPKKWDRPRPMKADVIEHPKA